MVWSPILVIHSESTNMCVLSGRRGSSLLQEIAKSAGGPWISLCARRQIARFLMGLLRMLFPGSLHNKSKLFVLPRLLLTRLSLHPVPSHAHLNLSSLLPKIRFCFWSEGHQIKRRSLIPSPLGWFGSVLTFLLRSLLMSLMLAC